VTPEQQRKAIAEACGWTYKPAVDFWERNGQLVHGDKGQPTYLPNYLNDLNAMHEAEKVLDPKGKDGSYEYWLRTVCHIPERESANGRYFYRATAAQRAEAFLRTIGKWKECK
jgi:hypothetical protein